MERQLVICRGARIAGVGASVQADFTPPADKAALLLSRITIEENPEEIIFPRGQLTGPVK